MEVFKNRSERALWVLGEAGIYEAPMTPDCVHETLVEKLDTTVNNARSIISKSGYFDRHNSLIKLTLDGAEKYNIFKENRRGVTSANIEHFVQTYCKDEIDKVWDKGCPRININYLDLEKGTDIDFAESVLMERSKYELLKKVINEEVTTWNDTEPVEINITNHPDILEVGDVQSAHVGRLISVKGRVLMQNQSVTRASTAVYLCKRCGEKIRIEQPKTAIIPPLNCTNEMCSKKGPFDYLIEESTLIDQQTLIIEPMEGQVILTVILQADLCAHPEYRDSKDVVVTGYLCAEPDFSKNGSGDHIRYVDAIGIDFAVSDIVLTDEDRDLFKEWGKNPAELRDRIRGTLAPDVVGWEDVKDAVTLMFFSDTKWGERPEDVQDRSSIHQLLIGDPSVAKSVIGKDMARLALKSSVADGNNSTAAGLGNAYVQVEGKPMLKGGVLNKGDQGVTFIDEVDKLSKPEDIQKLGSVMEDQIQIVNKAGFTDVIFRGRTSILCTANPVKDRIDITEDVYAQIHIKDHLLTRFDFIWVMRDTPDPRNDGDIYDSSSKRGREGNVNNRRAIPIDTFKKYLMYVKELPAPKITDEMDTTIKKYFLKIRSTYDPQKGIPIAHRAATTMIRVATCIARREMSPIITKEHAEYATRLYEASKLTHKNDDDCEVDWEAENIGIGSKEKAERDKDAEVKKFIIAWKRKNDKEYKREHENDVPKPHDAKPYLRCCTFEDIFHGLDMEKEDIIKSLDKFRKNGHIGTTEGRIIWI